MPVTKTEFLEDYILFHLEEPTRYGEPDILKIFILFPDEFARLERIAADGLESLDHDKIELPGLGVVVFTKDYDDNYSSNTHRAGSHRVRGPFLLEEYKDKYYSPSLQR